MTLTSRDEIEIEYRGNLEHSARCVNSTGDPTTPRALLPTPQIAGRGERGGAGERGGGRREGKEEKPRNTGNWRHKREIAMPAPSSSFFYPFTLQRNEIETGNAAPFGGGKMYLQTSRGDERSATDKWQGITINPDNRRVRVHREGTRQPRIVGAGGGKSERTKEGWRRERAKIKPVVAAAAKRGPRGSSLRFDG